MTTGSFFIIPVSRRATVVVARWEGAFDDERARVFGTPAEVALDLQTGNVAFAEAVRQGD